MGYTSSTQTSTSKSKTAPLSSSGESWNSLFEGIALADLEEFGGYDVVGEEKTEWSDKNKAATIQARIDDNRKRLDQITKSPSKLSGTRPIPGGGRYGQAAPPSESAMIMKSIEKDQKELDKLGKKTYTDYKLTKKEDPRVLAAIEKYGADSPEVSGIRADMKSAEVFKAEALADVEADYLKNLKKMSSGDFSYTDEQKAQVDAYIGPVRDIINKTTDSLLAESASGGKNLREEMAKIGTAIDQTGFDILDALKAADIQVQKSESCLVNSCSN